MQMELNIPFLGRNGAVAAPEKSQPAAMAAPARSTGMPLLGRLRVGRQLQILTAALVLLLGIDFAIVAYDAREATFGTLYVASVGKIRMLSQRMANAAQQASQGNQEAFKRLRESRTESAALVRLLQSGGTTAGVDLPPTSGETRPLLAALDREWRKSERNAGLIIDEEKNLLALGHAVRAINDGSSGLQELTAEIAALSAQSGGSQRQNAITAELMMLVQRMAKNANAMLAEAVVDPEVTFLLGKDTNTFRSTLQGLLQGSEPMRMQRVADAELRGKLGELESAFKEYQHAVSSIHGNQQSLVNAKRASFALFNDSETLLRAAEQLNGAYEAALRERQWNFFALGVLSVIALLVLLLIGKVYVDDSRQRAEGSERQNRANQDAILR